MMRIKHLRYEVFRAVHIRIGCDVKYVVWKMSTILKIVCGLRSQKPLIFRNLKHDSVNT